MKLFRCNLALAGLMMLLSAMNSSAMESADAMKKHSNVEPVSDQEALLFNFGSPESTVGWVVVNDSVMGGKSKGGFTLGKDGLVFSGSTNTDGGGFSSIRGPLPKHADLGKADGVMIRLRGAGARAFKLDLRQKEEGRRNPLSYRADIRTEQRDDWQDVRIPFTAFVATWRGQRVNGATLKPDQATDLGLFIYDGMDGPFRLEVDRIETYRNREAD